MVLRWLRARAPLSFYVTYVSLFSQIHFFGSDNCFLLTHLIDFEFCKISTDWICAGSSCSENVENNFLARTRSYLINIMNSSEVLAELHARAKRARGLSPIAK